MLLIIRAIKADRASNGSLRFSNIKLYPPFAMGVSFRGYEKGRDTACRAPRAIAAGREIRDILFWFTAKQFTTRE
jgi:hypothetical protein